MQIEIKVDENCAEPKIIIVTDKVTPEVKSIIKKLSEDAPQMIIGFQGDTATILNEADLYRVFAANGKIFAVTDADEYVLRLKLYELEQRLDKGSFVRISNSEIVNLSKVRSFDLSFVGTICITLTNGAISYVSRRYVAKIKNMLGI